MTQMSIIIGYIVFALFVIFGYTCRPCITGDAALTNVTVISADEADADSAVADRTGLLSMFAQGLSNASIAAGP